MNSRIKEIFPDISLCDPGCKNEGINFQTMTTICNCKFNNIASNELIQSTGIAGTIFEMINSSNILVLRYIFNYFDKSFGGIVALILLLSHIICTILYFLFGLNNIKIYILNLMDNYISFLKQGEKQNENNPPKKNSEVIKIKINIEKKSNKNQKRITKDKIKKSSNQK